MRLATILPERGTTPVAAVSVDAQNWVALHDFLGFFGVKEMRNGPNAPLSHFLPLLMPRFSEFTRKVSDWPEHGRIFQKRGGQTIRPRAFLPPVTSPPSFRAFSAFEQHVRTVRARLGLDMAQAWYELPAFCFSNPNSLVGQDAEIVAPANSGELDYGLELAVVMGDRIRNVTPEQAWSHVAGFTILNDFTARDLQRGEMAVGLGPSKGKDFATAVGPVLVTRDELADKIEGEHIALQMRGRVNGHEISQGNSKGLFHTFPRMIAHAARDAELFPGDLISSGTVGAGCILELTPEATNGWLKPGDVVELEIERLGKLRSRIGARPAG
jgi:fumarylacetoacetate (FAA) hydrolase